MQVNALFALFANTNAHMNHYESHYYPEEALEQYWYSAFKRWIFPDEGHFRLHVDSFFNSSSFVKAVKPAHMCADLKLRRVYYSHDDDTMTNFCLQHH